MKKDEQDYMSEENTNDSAKQEQEQTSSNPVIDILTERDDKEQVAADLVEWLLNKVADGPEDLEDLGNLEDLEDLDSASRFVDLDLTLLMDLRLCVSSSLSVR